MKQNICNRMELMFSKVLLLRLNNLTISKVHDLRPRRFGSLMTSPISLGRSRLVGSGLIVLCMAFYLFYEQPFSIPYCFCFLIILKSQKLTLTSFWLLPFCLVCFQSSLSYDMSSCLQAQGCSFLKALRIYCSSSKAHVGYIRVEKRSF